MGTPDANGKAPEFTGHARFVGGRRRSGDDATDEADVQLEVALGDVREATMP